MAEIVLTAFVTVLTEKLKSVDLKKMARSLRMKHQLKKWNEILPRIEAVLADAGEKQILDRSVQMWLRELHDVAYDIADLLDDMTTKAARRREAGAGKNMVLKFIPTCTISTYGYKMRSKLDDITQKLRELAEDRIRLELNANFERSNWKNKRWGETSLVDASKIVGREREKEELLEKLLGNKEECSENFSIVPIVGMCGIGKTALARLLFNDPRVIRHFKLRVWVSVSDDFSIDSISKDIFQAVNKKHEDFASLNLLHEDLKKKLSNKKFLLVLDDVWNEMYKDWELLQRPFDGGAYGSKIIVTTQKTNVARMMSDFPPYNLEVLPNQAALSLFARNASVEQNFGRHLPTLNLRAQRIFNKCGGLPLALIMLGRSLRAQTKDDTWINVLKCEILPSLRLSYYDLPIHLKQLFAYCSLFPKHYTFDKNKLVLLWMAEGYLSQSNHKSMETLGLEYFDELKSRSFFQQSTNDESQYEMHHLINDLALSIAGKFFFMLDDMMGNIPEENLHHLSFIRQTNVDYKSFGELGTTKRLRTFLAVSAGDSHCPSFYLSNNVLEELIPHLQFVRVLSLSNFSITQVPESIRSLKHVRYLNFSRTNITCLPKEVGDLYNLQSLLLCDCVNLSSLPDSLVKLSNLRHLDIRDTPKLNKLPLGIGGLTSLQTLSKVFIEGANGFDISELKGLQNLQGHLSIKGLDNVTNVVQAKEANLQQKEGLDDLQMEWSDVFDDSRKQNIEHDVLDKLRPHDTLRNLKIMLYGGNKFPIWVGDASFNQLTGLTLRGCRSCTHLPTLGHLPSLQKLYVGSMDEVKTLGFEFLAPDNSSHDIPAFPSLEVLEFKDMQAWERWSTSGGGNNRSGGSFPRLRELSIVSCPKLTEVSIGLILSLQVFTYSWSL